MIYPLNRNKVLKYFPYPEDIIDGALLESFCNIVNTFQCSTSEPLPKRSIKLQIAVRELVSLYDLRPKESNVDNHIEEGLGGVACCNAEIENKHMEEETDEVHEENIPFVNDFDKIYI